MIRIGLRLAVASRGAIVRLAVIAAAVALGVGLLLVSLAGINAVRAQTARSAWLNSSTRNRRPSVNDTDADPLWAIAGLDQYGTSVVQRIDVAPTGPRSPVPPGLPRLPGPGELYASPALAHLLASTPRSELADRYPGHQVGIIGRAGLASPDSLIIVIGHTPGELSSLPFAHQITSFETAAQGAPGDAHPGRLQFILAVLAGALLIPVLIFIGAATRLAAAQREQRFAALRLLGATPRQVSIVAAVEATVAAVAGVAAGFAVFFALRPLVAALPVTGQQFFHSDLSLHVADVAVVAVGVPIAAAIAARVALRKVQISPLGVTRRVTPPAPHAWRIVPLLAGIAELAYFVGRRPPTTTEQIRAYGVGFVLAMVGLVVAGPWLTMVGSRLMARRARRPAALIAARRLADNPRAAFRSVSGLIVALFICSSALGIITTILAYHSASTGGAATKNILAQQLGGPPIIVDGRLVPTGSAVPATVIAQLAAIRGVHAVAEIHVNPASVDEGPTFGSPDGLIACGELARIPALGRCAPGAAVAEIPWIGSSAIAQRSSAPRAVQTWPTAAVSADVLAALPAAALDISTDGSRHAIEQARTLLETSFPYSDFPSTFGDISADTASTIKGWRQLADVSIVASLIIAACSLAVGVASSLVERKRPFSLLRLTGTPVAVLRRVVALETALPLILVAAAAAGTGLLAAHLFLRSQLSETLQPPGAGYYVAVTAGLTLALAVIAGTMPLLQRITGPETARND